VNLQRAATVTGVLVLAAMAGTGGWAAGHARPRVVAQVRTVERTRTIIRTVYRTRPVRHAPSAATAAPAPPGCADACGQAEPVILTVGAYSGTEPREIAFSADGGNVATGLVWSSWPSGPDGAVPAGATATATGTVGVSSCVPSCAQGSVTPEPVTITLSDPISGTPSTWGQITEQIAGQSAGSYTYPQPWPLGAS
jgi:hypothetical protein